MKWFPSKLVVAFVALTSSVASADPQKLYLVEVVVSPSPAEYVAIFNPGATTVDLTNDHLADFATYYEVATSTPTPNASDFVVRFPTGATIAPGETQYVSIAGAVDFEATFGVVPTYEFAFSTVGNPAVPDMLEPFASAVGTSATLTNGGEPIMLFYWDGASALVTDIDYTYYGVPGVSNPAVDKTGVSVLQQAYLPDTPQAAQEFAPLAIGPVSTNTCRLYPYTEGSQTLSGSNGIAGSDETSEPSPATWIACENVAPVPEPSSLAGALAAAIALGWRWKTRR